MHRVVVHAHAFAATACTADPAGCQMPAVAGRPLVAAPLEQKLFKAAITWWLPEAVSPESSHRYIVSCSTERIRFCREESELRSGLLGLLRKLSEHLLWRKPPGSAGMLLRGHRRLSRYDRADHGVWDEEET